MLMFISRKNFMLSSAVQEEGLNCWYLVFYRQNKFSFSAKLSMKNVL